MGLNRDPQPGRRPHKPVLDDSHARTHPPAIASAAATTPGQRPAQALRARLRTERSSRAPGASSLTAAELRLLPLLTTHMPVPQIAAELFLSPGTIRSQLKSVYRKLDVTGRDQAVTRSRELGLLEG